MKKLFIAFALTSTLFSCKKETTNSTTNSNTTNNPNSVVCVDNPSINFISIGSPIGKLDSCLKDVDGNVYKTVTIGTQTWMAENLKTSRYNDGTSIPNVKDSLEWIKLTTGAWCFYNNNEKNNVKYGKLYNWYTVSTATNGNKNVCPTGWHVPTDAEWSVLTDYLGGESLAGGKMKEVGITSWDSPNTGTSNVSLFSSIPSGYRSLSGNGAFFKLGKNSSWWSIDSEQIDWAWAKSVTDKNDCYRDDRSKKSALSIRCLKD